MLYFLVATLAFAVGALVVGALWARSTQADLSQVLPVLDQHEQRLRVCEREQAERELMVADACTKIATASKRIQTRLKPVAEEPQNGHTGESVLDLRNRLGR